MTNHCRISEAQALQLVSETLMQLETAKKMVQALSCKAKDAVESELERARARVGYLEALVSKLQSERETKNNLEIEVERLRDALKDSEARRNEEMKNKLKMLEKIRSESGRREAELEAELRKSSYEMEELKAELVDKETELQSLSEENDALLSQLENTMPIQRARVLERDVKNMTKEIMCAKARLNKATEENRELNGALEKARGGEREVGGMREEIEKRNRKVARVTEQLEAAQAANAEMEAELRRLKVQSDQWRKAAEVAAAMLPLVGRTSSMDHCYDRYGEDFGEDLMKKKHVNMLRRFGVLLKKPLK